MNRGLLFGGFGAFGLGAAGLVAGVALQPRLTAGSYLIAFVYVSSLAVGALFFTMIGHAVGARWFVALRRLTESLLPALTLLALFFVPIVVGLRLIYPWAAPEGLAADEVVAIAKKHSYLNAPFFVARSVVYLAVWGGLGWALRRASLDQDRADEGRAAKLAARMRAISAGGLPVSGLVITFASFDWVMSLEPQWHSTIYGAYLFASAMVGATALLAIVVYAALRAGVLPPEVAPSHVQAVGKLLFTFVIFWAYIAFCQLLLIWIADLPDEAVWYLRRSEGGWMYACIALVVGHFVLPFAALLSWRLKRKAGALAVVAGWLLAMHYLDVYWLIAPALGHTPSRAFVFDAAAVLGLGGAAVVFATWRAAGSPFVARRDPLFALSLNYEDS